MVKGSGLEAQLHSHGRLCATTDGKSVTSPDQGRGGGPQARVAADRMVRASALENGSPLPTPPGRQQSQAGAGDHALPTRAVSDQDRRPGPCRPDTAWFAYQDCKLALRELGYDDEADLMEQRWFDVESA